MVSDNVNWSCRAFKVMLPCLETLMYSEEFLVIGVIVKFQSCHGLEEECNWPEFFIQAADGKNSSDGIVKSVSLNQKWSIQNIVGEDWSGGEGIFKMLEG